MLDRIAHALKRQAAYGMFELRSCLIHARKLFAICICFLHTDYDNRAMMTNGNSLHDKTVHVTIPQLPN